MGVGTVPVAATWSNSRTLLGVLVLPVLYAGGVFAVFHVRSPLTAVFMVVWFGLLLLNTHFLLFRAAYRLEVRGQDLYWFAPFRRGVVPVAEVTGVAPFFNPSIVVFKAESGVSPLIIPRRGITNFLIALHRLNPALPTTLPKTTRFFSGVWR
ncbi:hypothetical protein [Leifsonia shinshuensis]|uniref:hypothetical protein n=1 Tax=Leifsonia shinshuensis TaxID=150026 RepID=UPI00285C4850|nr:hypothetical protein [Leifsonia shinshuensis]MDR6970787.1 hypothetical protein [Leifsonia shinshuensis]